MGLFNDITKRFVAPSLPNALNKYDQQYQNQYSNVLRLYFNRLDELLSNIVELMRGAGKNVPFPYGAFQDSTDQYDGSTTSAYPLRYNTTDYSSGVSLVDDTVYFTGTISNGGGLAGTTLDVTAITSGTIRLGMLVSGAGVLPDTYISAFGTGTGGVGTYIVHTSQLVASTSLTGSISSKIKVDNHGIYNIQFSVQFTNTDSQAHDVDIWLSKNSSNVANTNSIYTIPSRHGSIDGRAIAALNFFIELDVNDYIEIMWHTNDSAVFIETAAAGTSPTRPQTPSVITTVQFVSAL